MKTRGSGAEYPEYPTLDQFARFDKRERSFRCGRAEGDLNHTPAVASDEAFLDLVNGSEAQGFHDPVS
jgi:hypothetical protein